MAGTEVAQRKKGEEIKRRARETKMGCKQGADSLGSTCFSGSPDEGEAAEKVVKERRSSSSAEEQMDRRA